MRKFLATGAVLGAALMIAVLPVEESAALIVAVLGAAVGVAGLSFMREMEERAVMIRLFLSAFALRVIFTFCFYTAGLVDVLGGFDDTVWIKGWAMSRHWRGWAGHGWFFETPPAHVMLDQASFPASIADVYGSGSAPNSGWPYFVACFYYCLDMRSQLALAVFNGFLGALTVVVIYRAAREFFTRQASLVAGGIALVMPGFLVLSALTIKESWLVLLEILTFFALWRVSREHSVGYGLLALVLGLAAFGFRFYVAWILLGSATLSWVCWRARRPLRTATLCIVSAVVLLAIALNSADNLRSEVAGAARFQAVEIMQFQKSVATGGAYRGAGSGVWLDYDITTPHGASSQLLVGSTYLMLAPFPWQSLSGRQLYALPDVLLWWIIVFVLIVPGVSSMWRLRPRLLLSILAFVLPLTVLYALTFGNVGLAYRQRAQLVPFLLILAAAGYESRTKANERLRRHRLGAHQSAVAGPK